MRVVPQGCLLSVCYILLQLRYLPVLLIRIKGMQKGEHEIKISNFADDTTKFLRDVTCLNRIQVILSYMKMHLARR